MSGSIEDVLPEVNMVSNDKALIENLKIAGLYLDTLRTSDKKIKQEEYRLYEHFATVFSRIDEKKASQTLVYLNNRILGGSLKDIFNYNHALEMCRRLSNGRENSESIVDVLTSIYILLENDTVVEDDQDIIANTKMIFSAFSRYTVNIDEMKNLINDYPWYCVLVKVALLFKKNSKYCIEYLIAHNDYLIEKS